MVVEDGEDLDEPTLAEIFASHAEEEAAPTTGFVVCITRGGKGCWLHHTGFCFRLAGEHFKKFDDCGQEEPETHLYNLRCRDCFPAAAEAAVREEAEQEASNGSEASSTDSREESEAERSTP